MFFFQLCVLCLPLISSHTLLRLLIWSGDIWATAGAASCWSPLPLSHQWNKALICGPWPNTVDFGLENKSVTNELPLKTNNYNSSFHLNMFIQPKRQVLHQRPDSIFSVFTLNLNLYLCSQSFQNAVGQEEATPDSLKKSIFSTFEPLHKFHTGFLREVEQRLALWWDSGALSPDKTW